MVDEPEKNTTTKPKKQTKGKLLSAAVFDITGKETSSVDLPETLFKITASPRLLAQYVRVYLSNQRQGTHSTKTRGEVSGSTRKIYRQKGTGRARHGARKAPIFVGGGVTFGPQSRSHNLRMSKKQRRKALFNSLTLKANSNKVKVFTGADKLTGKVKQMADFLEKLKLEPKKTLVIYAPEQAEIMRKTMGNIEDANTSQARLLNAYDVLKAETILFTKEALDDLIKFRVSS